MEQLYAALGKSPWDKISYADQPRENGYPADFMRINGIPWEGHIRCGHDPHLFARLVSNLKVVVKSNGVEKAVWTEKPIPELPLS